MTVWIICPSTSKYVYKNYCFNECHFEAHYFRKENKNFILTDKLIKEVRTCVSTCKTGENIVEYTKECVTNCPSGHSLNSTLKKCFISCASAY